MGAPEVGIPLIAVGKGMGSTGDAVEIYSNVSEGDLGEASKNVAIAFGKAALGKYLSNTIINNTGVTDDVSKELIDANIGLKIDGAQKFIETVVEECDK